MEMTQFNIMFFGKSGVGKSTLVNALFHENICETGIGNHCTTKIEPRTVPNSPLLIYDTPGFEIDGEYSFESLRNQAIRIIEENIAKRDINKAIHCILYCINANLARFEDTEINFIRSLANEAGKYRISIILVLTQAEDKEKTEGIIQYINSLHLPIVAVRPVIAKPYYTEINGIYYKKDSYGLEELITVIENCIDSAARKTFENMKRSSLEEKNKRANKIVATTTAAVVAECAIPIPFADSAMLIPTQVAMLAGITAVYGLSVDKAILTALVSSVIGTGGATILGKTLASGLLKLIPGVGSVAGAAISAGVGGTITTALGKAYIGIMNKIAKGEMDAEELSTEKGREALKAMFKDNMKNQKK